MEGIGKLIDESCILLDREEHSIETIIKTLTEQLSNTHPDLAPPTPDAESHRWRIPHHLYGRRVRYHPCPLPIHDQNTHGGNAP